MNEDELNVLALKAGFAAGYSCCACKTKVIYSANHDNSVNRELEKFKNLLVDKLLEQSCKLIKYQTRFGADLDPVDKSYNDAVVDIIKIIEKMK